MKYNLSQIMRNAWEIRKERGFTLSTSLRLAWREAKGGKGYAFHLEDARASITAYLLKLVNAITDEHQQHKYDILRNALLADVDAYGIAVLDGKTVGLCKYAYRNA